MPSAALRSSTRALPWPRRPHRSRSTFIRRARHLPKFTQEILEQAGKTLPFGDKRDFDEKDKGLIAAMKDLKIMADAGNVAWDMGRLPAHLLRIPDNGEKFLIELELTMMGAKPLEDQDAEGRAKVEEDVSVLGKLAKTMVEFDPRFEIMPGTRSGMIDEHHNRYEAVPRKPIAE